MGKYIKVNDLDSIVNELVRDDYYGMVSYDRLIKRLSQAQFINIPHINNIDTVIGLFEKATEEKLEIFKCVTNKNGERKIVHSHWTKVRNLSDISIVEVSKLTGISRPTLTKWLRRMDWIDATKGINYHSDYCIDDIIEFIKEVKEEQEKQ